MAENEEKKTDTKKTVTDQLKKEGLKAAANYFAPGVGGQAVESASQMPNKGEGMPNKFLPNGGVGKNPKEEQGSSKNSSTANKSNSNSKRSSTSPFGKSGSNQGAEAQEPERDTGEKSAFEATVSGIKNMSPMIKGVVASNIGCFIISGVVVLMVLLAIASATAIAEDVWNKVEGIFDAIGSFFSKSEKAAKAEKAYYEKLESVKKKMASQYHVQIDTTLITATLFYNKMMTDDIEAPENNPDDDSDDEASFEEQIKFFKNAKKKVSLLAKYQIIEEVTKYECNTGKVGVEEDTRSPKEIANTWTPLGMSQRVRTVYVDLPDPVEGEEPPTCPSPTYTYKTDINREGIYYYKLSAQVKILLINTKSFLQKYHTDMLSKDPDDIEQEKVSGDIYDLYEYFRKKDLLSYKTGNVCLNGITVTGDSAGTYDLEYYVAGVVAHEVNTSWGLEAMKAQAVIARTYALMRTNNCTKTIRNSTADQTFEDLENSSKYGEADRQLFYQAAKETAGQVLTYNGEMFQAEYAAWWSAKHCKSSYRPCSGGQCSIELTKQPNLEKWVFTMDQTYFGYGNPGTLVSDSTVKAYGGHCRGMSQFGAKYLGLAKNMKYDEILQTFYSDGVEISRLGGGPGNATTTEGGTIIREPVSNVLAKNNTSIEEFNEYIKQQIISAGVGTRNGVVAAGISLISGFYERTGMLLPYDLSNGKYSGFGVDPKWGTPQNSSSQPFNGLDCSGFVDWAIHNGGYRYLGLSAAGHANLGIKRRWSIGMTDDTANPGDLIVKVGGLPGTTGHVQLIVGKTEAGYIIAQAGSTATGMNVKVLSFTSKIDGTNYLVDMSPFYENQANKGTDIPY